MIMANFFYFDQANRKQGPYNEQQLQALATQGIIVPTTPMETGTGHKGMAGQIPGLKFDYATYGGQTSSGTTYSQETVVISQVAKTVRQPTGASVFSWLSDFSFQDIRLEPVILWVHRVFYAICLIAAILCFVAQCGITITTAFNHVSDSNGRSLLMLFLLPVYCGVLFLGVCFLRFCCELSTVILIWLIEITKLTKAARICVENKNTEQKET